MLDIGLMALAWHDVTFDRHTMEDMPAGAASIVEGGLSSILRVVLRLYQPHPHVTSPRCPSCFPAHEYG